MSSTGGTATTVLSRLVRRFPQISKNALSRLVRRFDVWRIRSKKSLNIRLIRCFSRKFCQNCQEFRYIWVFSKGTTLWKIELKFSVFFTPIFV